MILHFLYFFHFQVCLYDLLSVCLSPVVCHAPSLQPVMYDLRYEYRFSIFNKQSVIFMLLLKHMTVARL